MLMWPHQPHLQQLLIKKAPVYTCRFLATISGQLHFSISDCKVHDPRNLRFIFYSTEDKSSDMSRDFGLKF